MTENQSNQDTPSPQQTNQYIPREKAPGEELGMIALVAAFMIAPAGLILGLIARNKSKAAGSKNDLATAAIVIGAIFMILIIIWLVMFFTVFSSINEQFEGNNFNNSQTDDIRSNNFDN